MLFSDSRISPRNNKMTKSHERQDTSDDEHCSLVGGKKYLNVVHGEDKISFDSSSRRGMYFDIKIFLFKKFNIVDSFYKCIHYFYFFLNAYRP